MNEFFRQNPAFGYLLVLLISLMKLCFVAFALFYAIYH
jgi:hypothetical protein